MKKLIVLNHKMNLEYDQVIDYIQKINKIETSNNIIVCPSNIYLETFINHCNWGIASQNLHYEKNGNYTGEVSSLQLKSLGVEYSLVGHFERKKYFHEDNQIINRKLIACLESNIQPILCFGETGRLDDIKKSLDELLKNIENIYFIVFAYEPLIISGDIDIDKINEDVDEIYNYLYEKYKTKPNIIYGGGVVNDDINELLKNDKLNGILIGTISSQIDKISNVIEAID